VKRFVLMRWLDGDQVVEYEGYTYADVAHYANMLGDEDAELLEIGDSDEDYKDYDEGVFISN